MSHDAVGDIDIAEYLAECAEVMTPGHAVNQMTINVMRAAAERMRKMQQAGNLLYERVDHIGCKNCGLARVTKPGMTRCDSCIKAAAAWETARLHEGD
jgi:hypothetical protein